MNSKKTRKVMATLASDTLRNPYASKVQKMLAGSLLAQFSTEKETSPYMATISSNVLISSKYSEKTKSLAGSVLSQSPANKNKK